VEASKLTVYFIGDDRRRVKIGFTTNLTQRIYALQSATASELSLLRVLDGGLATERWLHKKFADYHITGEWFEFAEQMMVIVPPDEIPSPLSSRPDDTGFANISDLIKTADRLGCLSPDGRRYFAALLEEKSQ